MPIEFLKNEHRSLKKLMLPVLLKSNINTERTPPDFALVYKTQKIFLINLFFNLVSVVEILLHNSQHILYAAKNAKKLYTHDARKKWNPLSSSRQGQAINKNINGGSADKVENSASWLALANTAQGFGDGSRIFSITKIPG